MKGPKPSSLGYAGVMTSLKLRLKRSKITYGMLAQTMGVSESTLKKWFSARDGSFNRITQICGAIGIPVYVLLRDFEEQSVLRMSFSEVQLELFERSRKAFDVYWLMVYERLSKDQVKQKLGLTELDLMKLLYALDKANLLMVDKGDRVRVAKMRPVEWDFRGNFFESLRHEWIQGLVRDSLKATEEGRLNLQFFQLTPERAEEFYTEVRRLEEKYARLTILDLSNGQQGLKQIRFLSVSAAGSYIS